MGSRGSRSGALDGVDAVRCIWPARPFAVSLHRQHKSARADASREFEPTRRTGRTLAEMTDGPQVLVTASAVGVYGPDRARRTADRGQCSRSWLPGRTRDGLGGSNSPGGRRRACAWSRSGTELCSRRPAGCSACSGPSSAPVWAERSAAGANGRPGSASTTCSTSLFVVLVDPELRGPVNAVAPNPVHNSTYTATLGKVLRRPARLPVPSFGPRLLLGRGRCARVRLGRPAGRSRASEILEVGHTFRHPTLEACLRHLLGRVGPEGSGTDPGHADSDPPAHSLGRNDNQRTQDGVSATHRRHHEFLRLTSGPRQRCSSPVPAAASAGPSRSSWRPAASTRSRPCVTPSRGASMPAEANWARSRCDAGRHGPLDLRIPGRPTGPGQQRRHRRRLPAGRACQRGGLAPALRDQRVRGGRADRRGHPAPAGQRAGRCLHGQLVLDLRLCAVLFGLPGFEGCGLGLRRQPADEVAPFGIRVVEILPGPGRHRHVPSQFGRAGRRAFEHTARSGPWRPGCARNMPTPGWSRRLMRRSPSSTPSSRAMVRCATAAIPSPTNCSNCGAAR